LTDKEGFSPLHLTTKNNHTEIVSALINSNKEENKNVFDLVNAVNNDGKTALHLAASNGNPDIFTNPIGK
jgi:ankyrin repeat protein